MTSLDKTENSLFSLFIGIEKILAAGNLTAELISDYPNSEGQGERLNGQDLR